MFRVALVDDNALMCSAIKKILRGAREVDVVGTAASLAEALALLADTGPDLVLLDLDLPDAVGLSGLHRVRAAFPELPVLVVTMNDEQRYAPEALRAGAAGYLDKRRLAAQLVAAVRRISRHGSAGAAPPAARPPGR